MRRGRQVGATGGPTHGRRARPPGRGARWADARTTREAAGSVKKPANHAGVGVEAHGVDGGGGRRKPDHIDRKTKNKRRSKRPTKERKPGLKDREKDSLGQPANTAGGRTLGTGGAAPGGSHGGRLSQGRRAGAEAAAVRV